jgi:hypothetical protein
MVTISVMDVGDFDLFNRCAEPSLLKRPDLSQMF